MNIPFQLNTTNIILLLMALYIVYQLINLNKSREEQGGNEDDGAIIMTDWINTEYGYGYGKMTPVKALNKMIKEFGSPDYIDKSRGGVALWKKDTLNKLNSPFEKIMIKDEQVIHDIPVKHTDFLYTYYHIDVPRHKINGLKKISQGITYDSMKKIMQIRSYDIKDNVVTQWVAQSYADDKLTIDEAVGMLGPLMMEVMEDKSGDKYQQLASELIFS